MSETFSAGDKVTVVMASNNPFGACHFEAEIKYMPNDTGDCFRLLATFFDGNQKFILLNPNCSEFVGFSKEVIND